MGCDLQQFARTHLLSRPIFVYTAKINTDEFNKELNKDQEGGTVPKTREELFDKYCDIKQVANCVPHFEYIQRDALSGDQQFFFQFNFPNPAQNCKEPLAPNSIGDPRSFSKSLLERTPGGNFEGGEKVLAMLRSKWLENALTVRALPFVGYDAVSKTYCYQKFGYHKGREYMANNHGYLEIGKTGLRRRPGHQDVQRRCACSAGSVRRLPAALWCRRRSAAARW